ncbi:MAG TPA: CBM35 domain-containing protein, partial [Hymenobacter sp.]
MLFFLLVLLSPGYLRAADPIKLEAEAATLNGVDIATSIPGYSGTGYAWNFVDATDNVTFTFQAEAIEYDLVIQYTSPYGEKGYTLVVNGVSADKMFVGPVPGFSATTAGRFKLLAGQNTIRIDRGWGYFGIDNIALVPVSTTPSPIVTLVNGRAEAEQGVLNGTTVTTTPAGFSGTGAVTSFDAATDNVTLTFNATAGLYKIGIGYNSPFGPKNYDLLVNGESSSGSMPQNADKYNEVDAGKFLLKDGLNTVVVGRGWGFFTIDYIQ